MTLADVVQKADTPAGRVFDICTLGLIVFSIVSLTIETMPGLPTPVVTGLAISEVVVTILFTIEYILRIVTSTQKMRYIFSFYGMVDLIAILPFYLSLGVDLRGVRAFRLFRIFRILKLPRYGKAMERFSRALAIAKEEVVLFLFGAALLLYLSAVGIYYFENDAQPEQFQSIVHSLWWAVSTLTTVGYGDIYPITAGGKIFTFFVLMLGLGIVAVPAGLVASALSKVRELEDEEGKE